MEEDGKPPVRVKVMDKRRSAQGTAEQSAEDAGLAELPVPERAGPAEALEEEQVAQQEAKEADYLDDLRRLQADFENYRKRMLREQTEMAARASARLVERLLPVLDNFERAVSHGEGGPGVQLVYKDLLRTLEQEGLEEIEAENKPFDPTIHEAFVAEDDPEVDEPIVRSVYQRGYRLKGHVLRPAVVVVARPPEEAGANPADEDEDAGPASEDAAQA
jgi:molecular chaperone GrpE